EGFPAGGTAIDHGGHSVAERVMIRVYVAPCALGIDMSVDVDEPCGYKTAVEIHGITRRDRWQVGCDPNNLVPDDRDVEPPLELSGWIDYTAVLQQEIVDVPRGRFLSIDTGHKQQRKNRDQKLHFRESDCIRPHSAIP